MSSSKPQILVALAALAVLLAPARAHGWVAVRGAPIARGVAIGVTAGAVAGAVSRSYYPPPPSTVIVTPPPAAPAPAPAPTAVGSVVTTLPSGCVSAAGGRYQCGSVWYQPYFGSNGVYYQVVAP
jgi:hypothetical protein